MSQHEILVAMTVGMTLGTSALALYALWPSTGWAGWGHQTGTEAPER